MKTDRELPGAATTNPDNRRGLPGGWIDRTIVLIGLSASACWFAQALCILCRRATSDTSTIYQRIVLYDALPPGILAGLLLVAGAIARRNRRVSGARFLEFAGLAALAATAALVTFANRTLVLNEMSARTEIVELGAAMIILLVFRIAAATVIGAARWIVGRARRAERQSLASSGSVAELPAPLSIDRFQDLFSFFAVLLVWFCVAPIPPNEYGWMPLVVPGPSMFETGFPVGLVTVLSLIAAGLLRTGRDRQRLAMLDLFGIVALTMFYVAAALPFVHRFYEYKTHPFARGAMVLYWLLFGLTIAVKIVLLVIGFFRRRERLQFSVLGLLAFTLGCCALLMYWRLWRS